MVEVATQCSQRRAGQDCVAVRFEGQQPCRERLGSCAEVLLRLLRRMLANGEALRQQTPSPTEPAAG